MASSASPSAWRASARGLTVCVLDRGELGRGTSHVAAGMLAPISEADAGEQALLRLGLESARAWPAFAAELQEASGVDVDYRAQGTLLVARDRDEAEALDRELALRARFGLRAERLRPSPGAPGRARARADRPARARRARRPRGRPARSSSAALARAAERAGAVLRPGAEVRRGAPRRGRRPARRRARSRPSASSSPRGRGRAGCPASPTTRACRCGRSRASRCACATRAAPACIDARRALGRRLPRPAHRRPLRPRRDDGGARLRHGDDRRRRPRPAARRLRARARRARARGRGAHRRPAPRHARQRADRRREPGRARARLGHGPLPQRRAPDPGHGRPRRRRALRRGDATPPSRPRRFAGVAA